MPRPESTDMATSSKRRAGPGPGSEARGDDPSRPITGPLRSAIVGSGLAHHALARLSGPPDSSIRSFVGREHDLRLPSADELAVTLGLVLVRRGEEPAAPVDHPGRPITGPLRSAIVGSGLKPTELARAADILPKPIRDFLAGGRTFSLASAEKLAVFLGLVLVRRADHPIPKKAPASRPEDPVFPGLRSAIVPRRLTPHILRKRPGLLPNTI